MRQKLLILLLGIATYGNSQTLIQPIPVGGFQVMCENLVNFNVIHSNSESVNVKY